MGILTVRKRRVSGVGGALSKQRMESTARSQGERLEAEIAKIEQDLADLQAVDPARFEARLVKPTRADLALISYAILWVY